MYPCPQKLKYLQKKIPPPPGHHLKNLEHPDKKLKLLGITPMRNLKLLEKYQPSLPPAIKKRRKSQPTRKRKNITSRKNFNHPKIASTIMKKPQTPAHLKILNFSKNPNSIGKVFNSFEVTPSIKPSPHEKIPIPENLTPFRKLQSSHAHEIRN